VKNSGFAGLTGAADSIASRRMRMKYSGPRQAQSILNVFAQLRGQSGFVMAKEGCKIIWQSDRDVTARRSP